MSDTATSEIGFGAMSVPEFARFARIGQSSAWKAIRNQQLAARKIGRRTVILKQDAEQFLNGLPPARDAA
jgi:hypothetical protein